MTLLFPVAQPGLELSSREERHGAEACVTEAEGEDWDGAGGKPVCGFGRLWLWSLPVQVVFDPLMLLGAGW